MSRLGADGWALPVAGLVGSIAYVPAATWPSNTFTITAQYVKIGGLLIISGVVNCTAGSTTGAVTIPLPSGYVASAQAFGAICKTLSGVITSALVASGGSSIVIGSLIPGVDTYPFSMLVPVAN